MSTYTKQLLSQSLSGDAINVSATGSNTTLIHTTLSSSSVLDEVWIYACNSTSSDLTFKLLYGGTDFTNSILFNGVLEAYAGSILICPGFMARGNDSIGFSIYGNSSSLSGINVFGYVNRIS